jgi:hypothetical protein
LRPAWEQGGGERGCDDDARTKEIWERCIFLRPWYAVREVKASNLIDYNDILIGCNMLSVELQSDITRRIFVIRVLGPCSI